MTTSDWIMIGGIAVSGLLGATGWGVRQFFKWKGRVDRRLAGVLTEEKHNDICSKRTAELQKSVDGMRADIDRRFSVLEESVAVTREEMRDDLREHREESRETLGRIFSRIDAIADRTGGR